MRIAFAIPGDLATRSGGYGYDRELIRNLPACEVSVEHLPLPGTFPQPAEADRDAALAQLVEAAGRVDALLVDGLALGALPAEGLARVAVPMVALVHHPLALEAGLPPEVAATLHRSEQEALAQAQHIVVTSETTAETLGRDYAVSAHRITVALPGVQPALRASGSGGDMPVLLAVGAAIPRKAYGVLVTALGAMADVPWRLALVGSLDRDLPGVEALRRQIDQAGLAGRIELMGEVSDEDLDRIYDGADLFVLPSLYEGYGMVLGEAMSHGLPIVTSTGGAAARTVPDGAALKVPPGDADALGTALRRALSDGELRARLAAASWASGQGLPTWTHCAQQVAAALRLAVEAAA